MSDDETTFTVTSVETDIDPKTLPASPKKIHKIVLALGWDVLDLRSTVTHHDAVLMVSDGKDKLKGDVKTPAHDTEHVFLMAADKTRQVYFNASWLDRRFEGVEMHDPLGFPRELYVDFTPSTERKKTLGEEYVMRIADERDAEYNDGVSYLPHTLYTTVAKDFNAWLNDWVALATKNRKDAA